MNPLLIWVDIPAVANNAAPATIYTVPALRVFVVSLVTSSAWSLVWGIVKNWNLVTTNQSASFSNGRWMVWIAWDTFAVSNSTGSAQNYTFSWEEIDA